MKMQKINTEKKALKGYTDILLNLGKRTNVKSRITGIID